jgi:hypothetical protein
VGQIFVSYRRDDSADVTGRVCDRLEARFGADGVFKDVTSIPIGSDFRTVLLQAVEEASVILVVIGRQWVQMRDGAGRRRLDDPRDFVRIEVEAALARDVPVVPILVHQAMMPSESDLPGSMSELAYRHGTDIRADPHFTDDVNQLIDRLTPLLEPPADAERTAPAAALRQLSRASLEERVLHLERALAYQRSAEALLVEALALARETGSAEFVDLITARDDQESRSDLQLRVDRLAESGRSVWLRTYARMLAQAGDKLDALLVTGVVVSAKRSLRRFDIFLCHNAQDKQSVAAIAAALLTRGVLPWFDVWEAPPGTLWQLILEEDIGQCKATAVFVGPSGVGPWQNMEIYAILDDFTRRRRPIVPVILPGADLTPDTPLFLRSSTGVDLRASGADAAQRLLEVLSPMENALAHE